MSRIAGLFLSLLCAVPAFGRQVATDVESRGLEFPRFGDKSPVSLAPKAGGLTERIEVQSTEDHRDYVVKVYELKNVSASEVYQLIVNAVTLEGGFVDRIASGADIEIRSKAGVFYRYAGNSYLVVTAPEWMIKWVDDAINKLDVKGLDKAAFGTGYYYYRPKHRRPTELVQLVGDSVASGVQVFVPDDSRNTIYIEDTPSFIGGIIEALENFDQPARQVECLLRIWEIDESDAEDVGLDWMAWKKTVTDGGLQFAWGEPGKTNLNIQSLTAQLSLSPAVATEFLNYLAANGHAEIVTDTRLTVVNGRLATMDSTTQIPYILRNEFAAVPGDQPQMDSPQAMGPDGVIKEFSEGVRIEIAPTIGTDSIEFDVTATVASHIGCTPLQSVPIIQSSSVTSALDIQIGSVACISGLSRKVSVNERSGIPLLKDLPWIGNLFARDVTRTSTKHMCICITPTTTPAPIAPRANPELVPAWPEGKDTTPGVGGIEGGLEPPK